MSLLRLFSSCLSPLSPPDKKTPGESDDDFATLRQSRHRQPDKPSQPASSLSSEPAASPPDASSSDFTPSTPSTMAGRKPAQKQSKLKVNKRTSSSGAKAKGSTRADDYFSLSGGNAGGFSAPSRLEPALEKMFDSLHDDSRDEKDTLDVESSMAYFQNLGIDPEAADFFVVAEIVQAESFGKITRKDYVEGWKNVGVPAREADHSKYVQSCIQRLSTDPEYFKKVYRYAFIAGRDENQKALQLERAEVFWDMLFAPHIHPWETPGVDWLDAWKTFLNEKYNKTVSKDMWNQALEFANKTVAAGGLSFWDENSSWPTVIDQFVEYCNEKKIGTTGGNPDGMEVD